MKSTSLVVAGLFASLVALPFSVQAADAEKSMKLHSHMEEKTGIAASTVAPPKAGSSEQAAKRTGDNKLAKHFHPRDGK